MDDFKLVSWNFLSISCLFCVCVCVGLCVLSFLTLYWKASAWSTRQGFCLEKSRESVEVRNTFAQTSILFCLWCVCVYVRAHVCLSSASIELQPPPSPTELWTTMSAFPLDPCVCFSFCYQEDYASFISKNRKLLQKDELWICSPTCTHKCTLPEF